MNEIEILLEKPALQALGWTLFHFLWQGALVGLGMLAANIALRRRSAEARYAAACVALLLLLALPLITFSILLSTGPADEASLHSSAEFVSAPEQPGAQAYSAEDPISTEATYPATIPESPVTLATLISSARSRFASYLPWAISIWLLGVLLLSGRFVGGLVVALRLKRSDSAAIPPEWHARLSEMASRLRVTRPVRLCRSALVQVPTVIGWLRPVILLPASALTGLSAEQLEALLAHELAHIRRHDYLVNILQTAAETLLFYHPAVWWVSGQARIEREHCCDDLAVRACGDVLIYARALADLETIRNAAPQMAMAASGGSLVRRIERLVGIKPHTGRHRFAPSLAALGVLVMVPIFMAVAGGTLARHSVVASAAVSSPNPEAVYSIVGKPSPETVADVQKSNLPAEDPALNNSAPDPGIAVSDLNQTSASTATTTTAPGTAAPGETQDSTAKSYIDELSVAGLKNLSVDDIIRLKMAGVTAEYIKALKQAGLEDLSIKQIASMSMQGVTPEYIKQMSDAGYPKLSTRDLISLKIQGVTTEYIKSMLAIYSDLTIRTLIDMKIQGVGPEYVKEMASAGYDHLTARDLVSCKIQGVTPDYVKEMKAAGLEDLSARNLIGLKVQGVMADYVREMKSIGVDGKSARDLISMKIAGLTSQYIKAMQAVGLGTLTTRDLVGMGMQGVSPEYVKEMKAAGFENLSARQVIEMRTQGVTPDYVKELKSAGYSNLSAREIIELKAQGVDSQFLKRMQEHGFKNLTVRQLIQLKIAGID